MIDVERLWRAIEGLGVIEIGTWVHFKREDAETIATLYENVGPSCGNCPHAPDDHLSAYPETCAKAGCSCKGLLTVSR